MLKQKFFKSPQIWNLNIGITTLVFGSALAAAKPAIKEKTPVKDSVSEQALTAAKDAAAAAPLATPPATAAKDCFVLDDFSEDAENTFPKNWRSRHEHNQKEAEDKKLWVVVKDGVRKALHGIYGTHTITIVRKIDKWDMEAYPYLEWEWKAVKLPVGGDESSSKKNDSAASLYLIFEEAWPMKGSFLRFAWSSTQPQGSIISKRLGYEKIVITETGAEKLNTWKLERVNARDLAQKELKKKKGSSPVVLALNTDADGTASEAEAYYANFRFCK